MCKKAGGIAGETKNRSKMGFLPPVRREHADKGEDGYGIVPSARILPAM